MTSPSFEEEDWEAGISSLLGALPLVEPPPGMVDKALDHRPLHAGRIFLLWSCVAAVALVSWIGFDVATRADVVPPVSDLVAHHDASQSGDQADDGDSSLGAAGAGLTIGGSDSITVELDDAYSVYRQEGVVKLSELPAEGQTTIDGIAAWVDPDQQTVIVQSDDEVVTIVGIDEADVADAIRDLQQEQSVIEQVADRLDGLTSQLGFAELD